MILGEFARGVGVPRDGGVRAVDVGSVQVEHIRTGEGVGHVDHHVGQGTAGVHREGEGSVGLGIVKQNAVHVDAGHAPVLVGGDGEGHVVGTAAGHRRGLGRNRGVHLSVGGGSHRGGDHGLRMNRDGGGENGGDAVGGAGHRVGGRRGGRHRDDIRSGTVAPSVRVETESRDGDALALADFSGDRIHTGHIGHHRIAVVDAVVHLEGVAEVDDHLRILHLGLRHRGAVIGSGGLGLAAIDHRIGVAVRSGTIVGGHAAVVGVVGSQRACEIAVGDVVILGVAADTADIVAGDIAGDTAVLDVRAAGVRVVGAYDTADVVVGGGGAGTAGCTHNVGVDHQAVTDVDLSAAASHTGDGTHHTAGFHRGIDHHQGVDRTGVLDTAEKTGMEVVGLLAVEVVDGVSVAVEDAAEAVAGGLRLAGRRGGAADGHPVVGGVSCAVQPEVGRQVQRLPVEGSAAVHQLGHTRELLRRGDVEGGLVSVVPRDVRGTVPNRLRRHRLGRKAQC